MGAPNRFSGGCKCNTTCNTTTKKTFETTQYVTDVHWYPENRTLVIEKNNHKNVVVNFSEIIPDDPTLKDDIKVLVWNPNTEQYNDIKIADKGDAYTNALQKIVANIGSYNGPVMTNNVRKIAQQVVDENLVWKEWDDMEPQS